MTKFCIAILLPFLPFFFTITNFRQLYFKESNCTEVIANHLCCDSMRLIRFYIFIIKIITRYRILFFKTYDDDVHDEDHQIHQNPYYPYYCMDFQNQNCHNDDGDIIHMHQDQLHQPMQVQEEDYYSYFVDST